MNHSNDPNDLSGPGDATELYTIGEVARRTGVPVRTIRFWSEAGIVTPSARSSGGYRLYDLADMARVDLVWTLREFELDLETIGRVVNQQLTLPDVIRTHTEALGVRIRTLRTRRALLRSVLTRGSTTEEMRYMHKLAQLSAQERQQLIDAFVDAVMDGVDARGPSTRIAMAMRQMPTELPDEPSQEQVDAWIELAELVADADFQDRVRQMVQHGVTELQAATYDPGPILEHAGRAVHDGIDPTSSEARAVLDQIVSPDMPTDERRALADQLDRFTDERVERYWQLAGILNGRPPFPPQAPAFRWMIAALRAHDTPNASV